MSFYTMLWRSCLFCKFITFRRIPKFSNVNSDFAKVATVSFQRKPIPYICGLRARIECEPLSEHSTRSDRVTNIGYRLSLGASPLPTRIQNYPKFRILKSLSASRFASFFAISCLLSYSFLPRARPISTFTRLPLK